MTPLFGPSAPLNAAILKGIAIFSVLGSLAALIAVAVADWAVIGLRNEFVARNQGVAADTLSAEVCMMMLLNVGVVSAVVLNLIAVRLMLRGRHVS